MQQARPEVYGVDPQWVADLAESGALVRNLADLLPRELRQLDVAVIAPDNAWARIRAWRAAGLGFPVVVVATGALDVPDDRPLLEPVVLAGAPTAAGLARASEALTAGAALRHFSVVGGRADFQRAMFEARDGAVHHLTGLEVRLLSYLAARYFRVVGKEELQEQVWGFHHVLDTRTVEMSVARLRKKIGADSVQTIRGSGYRAVPQVQQTPLPQSETRLLPSLRKAAHLLLMHGRLAEAQQVLDQHAAACPPGDSLDRCEEWVLRARMCADRSDSVRAESLARQAMELAAARGWPYVEAGAICQLVVQWRRMDRLDECRLLLDRAETLFSEAGSVLGVARATALRADFGSAEEHLQLARRALALLDARTIPDEDQLAAHLLEAGLHSRIAGGLRSRHDLEGARASWTAAAAGYEAIGRGEDAALMLAATATVDLDLGRIEAGRDTLERLRESSRRETTASYILTVLALAKLLDGDVDAALLDAQAASDRVGLGHGRPETGPTDLMLAACRLAAGDLRGARALSEGLVLRGSVRISPHAAKLLRAALSTTATDRLAILAEVPAAAELDSALDRWLRRAAEAESGQR